MIWLTRGSVWLLYVARIIQGLSATVIWVVGYATIADTVGSEYLGTALGMLTPFMNAGAFTGPLVSGTLLPIVGYWSTWSVAMAVVCLGPLFQAGALRESSWFWTSSCDA